MKKESKATADKSKKSEAIDSKKIEKEENAASKVEEDKTLDNDGRVGTMLRETRLKKGEEVEEIAEKLKIRAFYLRANEDSKYDEIPEAPYGPGFVRSYADYLGLNAIRMAQLYKEETEAHENKENYYVLEPQAEGTAPGGKYIVISLLALILVYAGWSYYTSLQENLTVESSSPVVENATVDYPLQVESFEQTTEEVSSPADEALPLINVDSSAEQGTPQVVMTESSFVEEPAKTEEVKSETTEPTKQEAPKEEVKKEEPKVEPTKTETSEKKEVEKKEEVTPSEPEIDTDVPVVVKIKKETWFEAKDDETLYISKVVDNGFVYNVPEKEGMIISVGRVDAADVYVNGKLTTVFTAKKKTGIKVDDVLEEADNQ